MIETVPPVGVQAVSQSRWLIILSDRLPVLALVSRYLTNKLMAASPSLAPLQALTTSP